MPYLTKLKMEKYGYSFSKKKTNQILFFQTKKCYLKRTNCGFLPYLTLIRLKNFRILISLDLVGTEGLL